MDGNSPDPGRCRTSDGAVFDRYQYWQGPQVGALPVHPAAFRSGLDRCYYPNRITVEGGASARARLRSLGRFRSQGGRTVAIATPPAQRIASDFSPTTTRLVALQTARAVYRTVVERALSVPGADSEYLLALAGAWDAKLRNLLALGPEANVSDEAQAAFDYVTSTVSSGTLDADALMRWVDAYPGRISRRDRRTVSALCVDVYANWACGHPTAQVDQRKSPAGARRRRLKRPYRWPNQPRW
jgi:hypothetical protein